MFKFKYLALLVLFLFIVQPCFADDRTKILGVWKLVKFEGEFQDTGERFYDWGKNPKGYAVFTPEGRMMVLIEGEGRKAPRTDQDRASLLKTMIAYTGMYRLEGDKQITKVDASWNPMWNGTEQVRFYKFEGDRLVVITAWAPSPRFTGRVARGFMTWEREK